MKVENRVSQNESFSEGFEEREEENVPGTRQRITYLI